MPDPLAHLNARARLVRRIALAAIVPPLACHLAAPSIGSDAAPIVTTAEVVAAVGMRLAGLPLPSTHLRVGLRLGPAAPIVASPRAVGAIASWRRVPDLSNRTRADSDRPVGRGMRCFFPATGPRGRRIVACQPAPGRVEGGCRSPKGGTKKYGTVL
jgi:hypothetical protein